MNTIDTAKLLHANTVGLLRDRGGSAAVEFALLAPMLVLLAGGAIDLSRLVLQRMQLDAAAQAGADYARTHGWDAAGIQAAAAGATGLAGVSAAAPQLVTACVSGAALAPVASGPCPAGGQPGRFVSVQAQKAFSGLMPGSGAMLPRTITAKAVVRIQ